MASNARKGLTARPIVTAPFVPLGSSSLASARHVGRLSRFLVRCRLEQGETEVEAHLPDPGRLKELLVPGRRVWLRPAPPPTERSPRRKTRWTAVLVQTPNGRGLVSLDTTLPNRLIASALKQHALSEFANWQLDRAETRLGKSRFDFLLRASASRKLVLEVKSVTLVENRIGLFPDAVTARGARHVRELAKVVQRRKWHAAVLFVAQRSDIGCIHAARRIDPVFADALEEAKAAGVWILGRRCRVRTDRVTLGSTVPVD